MNTHPNLLEPPGWTSYDDEPELRGLGNVECRTFRAFEMLANGEHPTDDLDEPVFCVGCWQEISEGDEVVILRDDTDPDVLQALHEGDWAYGDLIHYRCAKVGAEDTQSRRLAWDIETGNF